MHHVEAEIARPRNAGQRIHIGAVAVDQPAAIVDQAHDLADVLLEQAERIGIGHHDARNAAVAGGAHRIEIDVAARIRTQLHRVEARHRGRGRIGAVRRIRDQDARAMRLAAIAMIGAHHQKAGELAVRAGGRLQGDAHKAADLGQPFLQAEHQGEIALSRLRLLQRMGFGKSGQPRDLLVDLRIVFHGARAERIEAGVDAEVALRQRQKVAHHVELGELRQIAVGGKLGLRQRRLRHVGRRQVDAASPAHAELVERRDDGSSPSLCRHRSTYLAICSRPATRRSTAARGCSSVTAISMCWRRCG